MNCTKLKCSENHLKVNYEQEALQPSGLLNSVIFWLHNISQKHAASISSVQPSMMLAYNHNNTWYSNTDDQNIHPESCMLFIRSYHKVSHFTYCFKYSNKLNLHFFPCSSTSWSTAFSTIGFTHSCSKFREFKPNLLPSVTKWEGFGTINATV